MTWMCTTWCSVALLILATIDATAADPRRVLLLYPYNNLFPVSVTVGEAVRKRLVERSPSSLELYTDFLDLGRFSGQEHENLTARYLIQKYQDRRPDVVVTLGPQSLRFVVNNQFDLGFDVPIIFCCTSRSRLAVMNSQRNVTGIISEFDLTKTMELAQRLQPDAQHIVVIAGAAEFDQQWIRIARQQLAAYEQKYETKYLVGLPVDELLEYVKRLSRDTIVILLTMFADRAGQPLITPDIVPAITTAATAPVYGPYQTYLGHGVLGGHMDSLETIGVEVADLALDILASDKPLPPRTTSGAAHRVDWRELKRWQISENQLPPGTEVRFRQFTLWEQYRWQIIAIIAIGLAQAAALAWLYMERRRRQIAQAEVRQRLSEVIHLNRTAVAGALSASIAHELNQPLAAIQSYAEAAMLYLEANPPNVARAQQILASILQDDRRASDIISHLRGLLRKKDALELQEFDLNEVVRDTLQIVHSEALKRGMALEANHSTGSLPVRGDRIHLQQVILNLAINGLDAMQNCLPGNGKMSNSNWTGRKFRSRSVGGGLRDGHPC